jgi:hypothetical protein
VDPIWATAAELWWIAPSALAAGTVGVVTVRRQRSMNGKRLGYDAARLELRQAQLAARTAADAVRVAPADAARTAADRAAARADSAAVASARRALRDAQLASKAATARVKAARTRVVAERSALGSATVLPLDRLRARHEAVLARWMQYETDPARAIAYPAMSYGRAPHTAVFLAAVERARDRRPPSEGVRVTASDFDSYRLAVDDLERSFDIAERAARGENVQPEQLPDALWDVARTVMEKSTEAMGRTAELFQARNSRRRRER